MARERLPRLRSPSHFLRVRVGVGGLEPPTSASQTRRAGRLRYTPADKSIIRTMDKRQEIFQIVSLMAATMISMFILIILSACQSRQNPPSILYNLPTGTPRVEPTVQVQPTAMVTVPPEITPVPENINPTQDCRQQGGSIESESIYSESLGRDLSFWVYLPPCYSTFTDINYPVVYLLHGLYFNEDQWLRLGLAEQMDRLIANQEIAPFIIVLPGESRFEPLQTSPFADALIDELIPWIDQHYRTLAEKDHRAIGGLSRGAAWSVRLGLIHYSLFGDIGAHSLPAFDTTNGWLTARIAQIPSDGLPSFFIDVGNQDPERFSAQAFADQINEHNISNTWHLFDGGHTEDYWSAHLETYLQWYARNW